jgi:predicted RNA-binding Zn ribbon-like protein
MSSLELIRDFVNTADLEDGTDELDDPEARDVREAIRVLLRANNGIAADVTAASAVLERAARRSNLRVGFVGGELLFESRDPVLTAVAEAMAAGSWSRLKACRSDSCQFAFIDTARNRSRTWCDMAVCGNRAKARRFRSAHA